MIYYKLSIVKMFLFDFVLRIVMNSRRFLFSIIKNCMKKVQAMKKLVF